jgi:pimeloyl-ACP methyl ester carboxylesterase
MAEDLKIRAMPEVEGVTHQYVNANGLRMHVAVAGPEDGDPVLLLHGWPEHWWLWHNVIPALAQAGYRVYAPDLRGFGWTEPKGKSKDYLRQNLASDILALIDKLGIDKPIRLAGHDWGGWISFLLCMREPEKFDRYMAFNIPPPWGDPGPFKLGDSLKALKNLGYQLPLSTPGVNRWMQAGRGAGLFADGIKKATINPEAWSDGKLDVFLDQFKEPARSRASMYLYRVFITREVPRIAIKTYVKGRMTVPTRMLFGTEDVAVNINMITADHSKVADDFQVELVENCGHFIVDEQPELVTERMLAWFGEAL